MALQPGQFRHDAVARQAACGEIENEKRTPYVGILFELVDGPRAGETYTWKGWLTDRAAESTIKAMRAAGWKGSTFADLSGIGDIKCQLVLGPKEHNGKVYTEVIFVNRIGGDLRIGKKLDDSSVNRLSSMFDAFIKDAPTVTGPPAADASRVPSGPMFDENANDDLDQSDPYGPGHPDDDIPF
jgi:hypothetical protein